MSRKWEGQQNPGHAAARKEPGQRGFRRFRAGPVLPESSPEPRCSIFFTALKFPGLQQGRRGCCSWKQAQGPGEAMESSSSREASASREEPWKGQASCLSGTAALALAISSFTPCMEDFRKQELKKRSRNYVKHVRKVFLKGCSSQIDFCAQWGTSSGAGWSPGTPDG